MQAKARVCYINLSCPLFSQHSVYMLKLHALAQSLPVKHRFGSLGRLDLRSYGPYSCCSSTPSSASGVGLTTVVGPVVTEMHRCGRSCGRRIFCAHCNTTILGHRAGPARHGPGTARRMSGRHGTPCLPCHAAAGLVPCHQPKHGFVGLNPCRAGLLGTAKSSGRASPRPVGFKTHKKFISIRSIQI